MIQQTLTNLTSEKKSTTGLESTTRHVEGFLYKQSHIMGHNTPPCAIYK